MSERVTSVSSSNVLSNASDREVGPDAEEEWWQRGLDRDRGHDRRKPARAALARIDAEEHEWSAIALRVELREERVGAGEVRLELPTHVRVGQISLVERQPPLGQRQPHGGVADRVLLPAGGSGRSGARRRRFRPSRHATGKDNRPGDQRECDSEPRDGSNAQALTTTVPAMRSIQPRRRLSMRIQM